MSASPAKSRPLSALGPRLSPFRRAALSMLEKSFGGGLKVVERGQTALSPTEPEFAVAHVEDLRAYRWIARGGVGAAESYALGMWRAPDLTALLRLGARRIHSVNEALDGGWRRRARNAAQWLTRPARLFRAAARRDVAAHYDLGNDFFALFLDAERAYSCAVYPDENATLDEASRHKFRVILERLRPRAGERFLDLGCGWGGLAMTAARETGCDVSALTLSRAQWDFVRARAAREGLRDKVAPTLADYRDFAPPRPFDKIASVEMIEAVGDDGFGEYFRNLRRLLAPDGAALVQAIVIPEERRARARRDRDFIQRRVFPGGALPGRGEMRRAALSAGLRPAGERDITPHYARTLADWRARFLARREDAKKMGFNEQFCRMWEYYLCYCEAGFAEKVIGCTQAAFVGPTHPTHPTHPTPPSPPSPPTHPTHPTHPARSAHPANPVHSTLSASECGAE